MTPAIPTQTEQLLSPIHVMVDLETLGTKPGCKILSIGACTFQVAPDARNDFFYVAIDSNNQCLMDEPDPDTVRWWSEQSEDARADVFNNPLAKELIETLDNFNDWLAFLRVLPTQRIYIWGNGATFDEPILLEACKRYGVKVEWTFRDSVCFRTLKELGKLQGVTEPEFTGTKHNALHDAIHQAKWADKILHKLGLV